MAADNQPGNAQTRFDDGTTSASRMPPRALKGRIRAQTQASCNLKKVGHSRLVTDSLLLSRLFLSDASSPPPPRGRDPRCPCPNSRPPAQQTVPSICSPRCPPSRFRSRVLCVIPLLCPSSDELPKSPFQTFVEVLKDELRKNRELQDNVKQLQGDVEKFQDSEAMKRAKEAYERARVRTSR